jgi:hypothetical protein
MRHLAPDESMILRPYIGVFAVFLEERPCVTLGSDCSCARPQ